MNKFIVDIDGTLIDKERFLPGGKEFLEMLVAKDMEFVLATNSVKPISLQRERFRNLGLVIAKSKFYSPVVSINQYLKDQNITRVFVVGSMEHRNQIDAIHTESNPQCVLFIDFESPDINYGLFQQIFEIAQTGVEILTASKSVYYRTAKGNRIDTGAFVSMFQHLTGREIKTLGKPSIDYFAGAARLLGEEHAQIWVIGDDADTDIKGAADSGMNSILVKTGKFRSGDEKRCSPNLIVEGLGGLIQDMGTSNRSC